MLFAYDLDGMAPKRRILEALYSAKKDHTVSTLARQAFSKSQFHMDDEKRKQAQRFAGGAFKEMRERPELDFGMMRPPFLRRSEMLRGDPTRGEQEMCASYEVDPLLKEYHAEAKLGKGRDVVYGDGWQSFAKLEADFFAPPAPNLLAVPVEIEFDDGSSITIKVTADESLEDILRKIAEAIIGSP